jgi:hypothetical protein
MRIYLIKEFWDESWREVLPVNSWYEGELTPTTYNPQTLQEAPPAYIVKCNDGKFRKVDGETLQEAPPAYIVKCNDGKFRKVDGEYFITQEEWRERQLNQILSVSL